MALILDGLTKTFSSFPAVNNLSYTMDTGVYGLLGVNGAGKTTLMRMLCTLLTPTSGTITWDGQDIFSLGSAYRNLLGYLPQDFGYYPDFSVQDYLLYIASIKGLRPATARQRMQNLLEQVGLTQVRRQKMKKLSGGMKRRAGIAQAMLNDPKILILDEPTAGLDPKERIRFRNLISELAENRLVLLSTHIVSDVEYIADQILLMKDGSWFTTAPASSCWPRPPPRCGPAPSPGPRRTSFSTSIPWSTSKPSPRGSSCGCSPRRPPRRRPTRRR